MKVILQEKLGSSCRCSKELQISKSIGVHAGFLGDMLSWKRMGLAEVGEKGKSKGGKGRSGKSRCGKSIRSFLLRTHTVGGVEVKKLLID